MPDLDLAVATSCYGFIREELSPYGIEPSGDTMLRLEAGAGTNPKGEKVYRPYILMAALLARAINQKHLQSGEGAVLRDANLTIAAWEADQRSLDAALGLTVPSEPLSGPLRKGSFSVRSRVTYD